MRTTGNLTDLRLAVDRSPIKADGSLLLIAAKVLDNEENFVSTANNTIAFFVPSAGEDVATVNGDSARFHPRTGMHLVILLLRLSVLQ